MLNYNNNSDNRYNKNDPQQMAVSFERFLCSDFNLSQFTAVCNRETLERRIILNIWVKERLDAVGKKHIELLFEVRKRGFAKMSQPAFSAITTGATVTPQADAVLEVCSQILNEWEAQGKDAY